MGADVSGHLDIGRWRCVDQSDDEWTLFLNPAAYDRTGGRWDDTLGSWSPRDGVHFSESYGQSGVLGVTPEDLDALARIMRAYEASL